MPEAHLNPKRAGLFVTTFDDIFAGGDVKRCDVEPSSSRLEVMQRSFERSDLSCGIAGCSCGYWILIWQSPDSSCYQRNKWLNFSAD